MKVATSLKQLCDVVKGTTSLDHSFFVEQLASLEKAGPADVAVILDRGDGSPFDNVAREQVANSKAGVLIAKEAIVPGKNYLLVDDPLRALTQLAQQAAASEAPLISSHAMISPEATLGDGVTVGAGTVIEAGAQIGTGTVLHPRVFVGRDCVIGAQSIIHSGTVIGSDGFGYQVTKTGMRKVPQTGHVVIGNQVEIGANCTIDRATFDATIIEDGVKMDNLIHIAHNVRVGAATAILAQTGIAGGAIIGRGCQIGGQVAIKDHVTIGDGARIVSKSAIMKDIPPRQTVCGQPAISFREWKKQQVVLTGLGENAQRVRRWLQQPTTLPWWQRLWHKLRGK